MSALHPHPDPPARHVNPWASARQLLADANELLNSPTWPDRGALTLEGALADAQLRILDRLRGAQARKRDDGELLADTLAALIATSDRVHQEGRRRRMESGDLVRRALTELRSAPTAAAVMDRAVEVLCTRCGFDRAFLFRVENAEMVIDSVHFTESPEWAAEFHALALVQRPQLTHQLLETEMIRRRAPVMILNPQTDPRTFKPLVEPVRTSSYVAAPVMPDDHVIAFLHADCYFQGREVDEIDRDRLWAFAEGFGFAVERAVLLERLHAQGGEVRRLVSATNAVLTDLCDAELRMTRTTASASALTGVAASELLAPSDRISGLLTRREAEVIALMAEGATNAAIGRSLVISLSTVKSHAKHLMHKLRASNRSEAVATYNRILLAQHDQPPDAAR